ncbi:glycoside hydrolase family 27 protein [Silvibacterium acidisoli]|uniref:glycoside hydrolase family 27 protein n=1 Tax=Acidobacteriaceae bacterium ZG23-2 TaxID=2883246 RepID=UPI00406CD1C6
MALTSKYLWRCLGIALLALSVTASHGQELASTPSMGWNSWNHFRDKADDATIRAIAEAMVTSGMRDAGYVYVNIDDDWEGVRDAQGNIQANAKFPDMKALADFVHSKGLKLGIYSSPGLKTCAGYEGSYGHEEQDAKTFAAWGIDYLKYDLCGMRDQMKAAGSPEAAHNMMVNAYLKMRDALQATERPIVYSLCQYGVDSVWEWGASVGGNAWRTTYDIRDNYASMVEIGFSQAGLAKFARPGHWNDPDMLEIGNGGMNLQEYRTHISLWAILAAPLLAGNDLTHMTPETVALLTNKDVIAIDQDQAGKQGDRVSAVGPMEVWLRPLADGGAAIGIFNRHPGSMKATVDLSMLGLDHASKVRDVWAGTEMTPMKGPMVFQVPGHGVVLLRVSRQDPQR